MVAKIKTPTSIVRALNHNEQKVQKGAAECIYAGNFLREANELNFSQKRDRFENLIALNDQAKTNSLHISLNFDPSDKIDTNSHVEIASLYMERIGFAEQPYLVYHHNDAGHPHIHIVTTSIQSNGKRIDTFNIGRNQSEQARKEIELSYNLVRAEGRNSRIQHELKPLNVQKAVYGKSETKRGITNVLDAVVNTYKYTSLAELNAVLRQYNVVADRGKEDSETFRKRGVVYRILDKNGNKAGVPIKASSIYSKPTLVNLEKKFEENEIRRKPDLKRIKTAIDWTLVKPHKSLPNFIKALEKERITTVVRQSEKGIVYGLTYIDYQTKAVFNGSDIGKEYSAKGIMDRCGIDQCLQVRTENNLQASVNNTSNNDLPAYDHHSREMATALERFLKPSSQNDQLPNELNQIQKRKKKKSNHL